MEIFESFREVVEAIDVEAFVSEVKANVLGLYVKAEGKYINYKFLYTFTHEFPTTDIAVYVYNRLLESTEALCFSEAEVKSHAKFYATSFETEVLGFYFNKQETELYETVNSWFKKLCETYK